MCVFTVSGAVGLSIAVMYGWSDPLGYRGARGQSLSEDPEAREMALKQWNRKRVQKKNCDIRGRANLLYFHGRRRKR